MKTPKFPSLLASLLVLIYSIAPVSAQTAEETLQHLSASHRSWFGYSYHWEVEQTTEITAGDVNGPINVLKKQLESLPSGDLDSVYKKTNSEALIQSLREAVGTDKMVLEITASLVSPSKWRVECHFIKPEIEATTVFLSMPDGSAFEYLYAQKLIRYHEAARYALAHILRGIPAFVADWQLTGINRETLKPSPDGKNIYSFISKVSHLKYDFAFNPKTFEVTDLHEFDGNNTVVRSVRADGECNFTSKQFDRNTGAVTQQQIWHFKGRHPLTTINENEFVAKIPDDFDLMIPNGDHSHKIVSPEEFRNFLKNKQLLK